jgi:hypothetical protein
VALVFGVAVVAVAVVVMTTAGEAHPQMSDAKRALALWNRFPASAKPRPIVLVGEGPVVPPATGFPNANAKLAFIEGRFVLRTKLPSHTGTVRGYQLIPASSAFKVLKTAPGKGQANGPRLAVTRVWLGSAKFYTDRGRARLPAWWFKFRGVKGHAAVIAIGPPPLFNPPAPRPFSNAFADYEDDTAAESGGGKTVSITFVGAHAGNQPCDASYRVTGLANAHAVAFTIVEKPVAVPPGGACSDVGYLRTASLHLKTRLGGRALIDSANGGELAVTRHG